MPLEINCMACGAVAMLRREPKYDVFKKVGETLSCMDCGHVYATEDEVPYRRGGSRPLFGEEDKSKRPAIFDESEANRTCRHCEHYTVNPFTQRCGLHNRIIQATDCCDDFSRKPPPKP